MTLTERIHAAADYLSAKTDIRPTVGLILGSGLGDFADTLANRVVIPFADIPDFPRTTVEGHTGAFVFGHSHGRAVVVLQGRLHYFEGHSMQTLTLPVRVMSLLGVRTLILTNASGGVNRAFVPGDLMLITDHINLSGANPLVGANLEEFGPRFPDVTDLYTASLRRRVLEAAAANDLPVQQGVYMMFSGPNYETPAEVHFARVVGADAIGMSTVPEALVAAHCGMQVVGVSCVTCMGSGVTDEPLDHNQIVEVAALVHDKFHKLVGLILEVI